MSKQKQDFISLFKAYDLRGRREELSVEIYYWLGYGLVRNILLTNNLPTTVVLGRDCRLGSLEFYQALAQGILAAGGQIYPLGLVTTDMLYAACQTQALPGAMVTASHNPKDYNGLKIVKKVPQMLGLQSGLAELRDFVLACLDKPLNFSSFDNWPYLQAEKENSALAINFLQEKILEICPLEILEANLNQQKLKVVVDCANGMATVLLPKLQEIYGTYVNFIPLFAKLDGNFPEHPPDPSVTSNLQALRENILAHQADFGIALDGDGDRAVFVDEQGEVIHGEYLTTLFAVEMLKIWQEYQTKSTDCTTEVGNLSQTFEETESKANSSKLAQIYSQLNPAVVYAISYSRCLPYAVLEHNGIPIVSKQGHTFIKDLMQKYQAVYGGEATGHHYFGSFAYMDSGALAIALFLRIVAENKGKIPQNGQTKDSGFNQKAWTVSSLCRFWQERYFVSKEINFPLPKDLTPQQIMAKIQAHFADGTISYLDGITVYYPDWKFTLRFGNTEPLMRLNLETIGQNLVQEKLRKILDLLNLSLPKA